MFAEKVLQPHGVLNKRPGQGPVTEHGKWVKYQQKENRLSSAY
jgi:hypothetical protein